MTKHFDVIVTGVGSMGSATCYKLAQSGLSVLGLEAKTLVNDEASHSGQSRLVRKAYFEHPDYVPLLLAAYQGWDSLEKETGRQFYHPAGIAYFGKKQHPLLQSVKGAASQYALPLQELNQAEIKKLLPDFKIPDQYESFVEPEAGFVCTDQVIQAYTDLARQQGASIEEQEAVKHWTCTKDFIKVDTAKATYTCDRLILTCGAGMVHLLPEQMPQLRVTRQLITWVKPKNISNLKLDQLPCWVLAPDDEKGIFYGFPMLPESYGGSAGLKVAHHYPGEAIDQISDEGPEAEKQKIAAMMQTYMPDIFNGFMGVTSCLYTYSPDEHFVIDFVPETDQKVIAAAGFSGHGFKFVPVIGEVLSDLAVDGKTDHPVAFLKASRKC